MEKHGSRTSGGGWKPRVLAASLIILVGVGLRLPGLFNDFWLDEIWGYSIARQVSSVAQVFTGVHFDTNHWLYTLYMYVIGQHQYWPLYRLFSLAAGILTMPMLALACDESPRTRFAVLVLSATSFFLIFYSSEARGYATAMLFAVTGFYTLMRHLEAPSVRWVAGFWASFILGLLSHLTYLFVYGAFGLWSAWHAIRSGRSLTRKVRFLLGLHAVPLALFGMLYWIDIQYTGHGGGTVHGLSELLLEIASLVAGGPGRGTSGILVFGGLASVLWFELYQLRKERSELFVFYLSALVFMPAALVTAGLLRGFDLWTYRHFAVLVPLALILLARFLNRMWRGGRLGRTTAVLLLLAYLAGNGAHLLDFYRTGRGQYLDALSYITTHTEGSVATVGSDHDFRNKMVVSYYGAYLPEGPPIQLFSEKYWPEDPQWFLAHSDRRRWTPPSTFTSPGGSSYELVRVFPFSGLSGWHWALYRTMSSES